jgi:hypothetical protein
MSDDTLSNESECAVLIKPAKPSTPQEIALSPLDLMVPYDIRLGFIFKRSIDAKRLCAALAETLVHFPQLAGRASITEAGEDGNKGVVLNYNDEGVPFERVELDHQFEDFEHNAKILAYTKIAAPIDSKYFMQGKDPPLRVRLSDFMGGGCLLGVSVSHAVADPTSFGQFLQSWSHLASKKVEAPQAPVHDGTMLMNVINNADPEWSSLEKGSVRTPLGQWEVLKKVFNFIWNSNKGIRY